MANSAADAGGSELEIRRKLVEDRSVDVMVAVAPNFFYTVALPCTLWFFDKGSARAKRRTRCSSSMPGKTFRQVDRAHRDFLSGQVEFLANITRLHRGEKPESIAGSEVLMTEHFPDGTYVDVPGLCRVVTIDEIERHGWSLNPAGTLASQAGTMSSTTANEWPYWGASSVPAQQTRHTDSRKRFSPTSLRWGRREVTEGLDISSLSKRIDRIGEATDLRATDFADVVLGLLFLTLADLRYLAQP